MGPRHKMENYPWWILPYNILSETSWQLKIHILRIYIQYPIKQCGFEGTMGICRLTEHRSCTFAGAWTMDWCQGNAQKKPMRKQPMGTMDWLENTWPVRWEQAGQHEIESNTQENVAVSEQSNDLSFALAIPKATMRSTRIRQHFQNWPLFYLHYLLWRGTRLLSWFSHVFAYTRCWPPHW